MGEPDGSQVVAELEARVRRLEDQLALYSAVSTYGPAVDSGVTPAAVSLWAEDGTYSTREGELRLGRDALAAVLDGPRHQQLIREGCGHLVGLPLIEVDGDRARGVGYSVLYRRRPDADEFQVWRVSAVRWEWERQPGGWRTVSRTNRLLDGAEAARALFGSWFEAGPGAPTV